MPQVSQHDRRKEPFFFEGAGRREALDSLLNEINHQRDLVIFTGQTGSGRSFLLKKLGNILRESRTEYCLLDEDCTVLETEEELYKAIAAGFGLEDKPLELLDDLVERVEHFIDVSIDEQRRIVIAVDDARQHTQEVVAALIQLVGSHKGLTLVLAGEDSLIEFIEGFHTGALSQCHHSLKALSADEIGDFVSEQAAATGISLKIPVDDQDEMEAIFGRTGGNLKLLMREVHTRVPALKRKNPATVRLPDGLPVKHLAAMAITVLFIVAVIIFYPEDKTVSGGSPDQSSAAVDISASSDVNKNPDVDRAVTPLELTPVELAAEPENPAPVDPAEPSQNAPAYSSAEQALLAAPPDHVALQVVILSSEQSALDFIAAQEPVHQQQLSYYRRGGSDKVVMVIVYGNYPDKASALAAVETLSPTLKSGSPWPRPFSDIQRDITNRISP